MKKKQLNEEQLLNEFIGKIASYFFMKKAGKLVDATKNNPRLHGALSQYKQDTEDFRKKMKNLGISSGDDLVAAVNDNPALSSAETPKQRNLRIRKEFH